MKRTLLALALVLGLFVFPSSASATHDLLGFQSAVDAMLAVDPTLDPPPNDGRRDFVVGGAQASSGANFGFSAHSDPLGEDPFGHLSATFPAPAIIGGGGFGETLQIRFKVTCLAVSANLAAIGGVQTEAAADRPPGTNYLVLFRDSGLPGGTGDGLELRTSSNPVAQLCPIFVLDAALAPPITNGNILIHDAMP
jgi:hypothetical protein